MPRFRPMVILFTVIAVATLAYTALCFFLYLKQDRMVFYPTAELLGDPLSIGIQFEPASFFTADNARISAWFVPAPADSAYPRVALFCHGNGGNISHRLQILRVLHNLGWTVLLFDYRGYGQSGGVPSEEGLYSDARAAWDYLVTQRGIDPANIAIGGESLGGAVATKLAIEKKPCGLFLLSTLTSVPELGAHYYPYLPLKFLSKYQFNTRENVVNVRSPILIAHSPQDEIVPFSHGKELFESANEPKSFLEMIGDHNDGFMTSGPVFTDGLEQFLESISRSDSANLKK